MLKAFIQGLFGKAKVAERESVEATPLVLTTLSRARTIEPSWTESATALSKYHKARHKSNRVSNRSRAINRNRHPMSAHA